MLWVLFALISAFGIASADAVTKRCYSNVDASTVMFARIIAVVPFALAMLPWVEIPSLFPTNFFWCLAALFPLDLLGFLLYLQAIKISPLSLTVPYLALTPAFLIITGYFLLGEQPTLVSCVGIILTTMGAILLQANHMSGGLRGWFATLRKEKGSLLMIFVAFLFSITSILGKVAVSYTNPMFFSSFYIIFLAVVLGIVFALTGKTLKPVFAMPKPLFLLGIFGILELVGHFSAIMLTQVSLMIAVKRTSLLFAIIYGALLFKEVDFRERFAAGCLMLAGVFLVTYGSME